MVSERKSQTFDPRRVSSPKATFEQAIVATGFGKFNILLLFFIFPSSFTQAYEQMSLSYVLPIAECDLNLTLQQKGLLNAITFAGMISSGVFFGIICDIFGRKKLIVYGFLLNTVCQIIAACSANFMTLMISKFFCGFIFNGPFSAAMTYLSEFHSSEYRARVQLIRGIAFSTGFLILPVIAWIILPLNVNISLFGLRTLHSWNLFLLFCTTAPLLAAVEFMFMPESPKFLMSAGKNEEAIKVFQLVYSMNTGKPESDFPITELIHEPTEEVNEKSLTLNESISKGWKKLKPIFMPPYIFRLILSCTIALIVVLSINTVKLWIPQLLQITNDFHQNGTDPDICEVIDVLTSEKVVSETTCQVNHDNSFVYKISMLINGVQILVFVVSGFFVRCLGKTNLMCILATVGCLSSLGIYFAPSSSLFITFFTTYSPSLDLCGVMNVTVTLELFPTMFRTVALSFTLMSSRIGAVLANTLFSYLVNAGCLVPFLFCSILTAGILATVGCLSSLGIYFAPSSSLFITFFTTYSPILDLCGVMNVTVTLELFPTMFRTVALSFTLMSSRIGAVLANTLFSYLVNAGCLVPFLFCSILTAAIPFLVRLYPNTENKALV